MDAHERWSFDVHGYLVRRGALEPGEVAALEDGVDALELSPPDDRLESQRFNDFLPTNPAFVALLDHRAVFDVLVELCGPTLRLDHLYGMAMAPGTEGLWMHGGGTPFDPAQFYVVSGGRISCGLVAVQWVLRDQEPGSGGFACVPGSHTAAFARPPEVDLSHPAVVEVPATAGDVIVFTEALTHGTLPWRGPHTRRALFYKYSPGSSTWGRVPTYPDQLWPMLSERQRLLLEPPYVARRQPLV